MDNEIRSTDIPERLQLRDVPLTAVPDDSTELDDEAEWIYKQAFCRSTVSNIDANLTQVCNCPRLGRRRRRFYHSLLAGSTR